MPIVAILAGVLLIDLALRGTEHEFAAQLAKDFGGDSQFVAWIAVIVIFGGLGYVRALRPVSTGFLALIVVVIALREGGVFQNLAAVIEHPPAAAPVVALPSGGGSGSSSGSGGGGIGGLFSAATSLFGAFGP